MIKTGWKNDISGNLLKYRINESMKDREDGCINKWIYIYIYILVCLSLLHTYFHINSK